jgi:hypothetical protein
MQPITTRWKRDEIKNGGRTETKTAWSRTISIGKK